MLGAAIGRCTDAEQPLAADLLGCFRPGMLVLADRQFLSWFLARAVLVTGAHILWRASAWFALRPVRALPDGTYLAELKPPRKSDDPAVRVRIIEYSVHTTAGDGAEETSEVFCLVTSLLDPAEDPALDLACAYPLRWGARPSSAATRPAWARASPSSAAATPGASCRRCGRCPHASSAATAQTGPAPGKPRRPATSGPASPASPA
jgi:hypothetical protein